MGPDPTNGSAVTAVTDLLWSIPEPLFLVFYAVTGAGAATVAVCGRRMIAAGGRGSGHELDSRPEDVAFLRGGPQLAVCAALSAMHVDGTVVTSPRTTGQVRAGGPLTRAATPLQRAIHSAAHRLTPARTLRTHEPVRLELSRTARRLEGAGLLLGRNARRLYRGLAWPLEAVVGLGAVWLVAGGRLLGPVPVLVAGFWVVAAVLATDRPRRTVTGDAALAGVRARHPGLAPSMRPDWTAGGAAAAAMGVGAFGIEAMRVAAPAFADELAVRRPAGPGARPGRRAGRDRSWEVSWSGDGGGDGGGGDGGGGGGDGGGGGGGGGE